MSENNTNNKQHPTRREEGNCWSVFRKPLVSRTPRTTLFWKKKTFPWHMQEQLNQLRCGMSQSTANHKHLDRPLSAALPCQELPPVNEAPPRLRDRDLHPRHSRASLVAVEKILIALFEVGMMSVPLPSRLSTKFEWEESMSNTAEKHVNILAEKAIRVMAVVCSCLLKDSVDRRRNTNIHACCFARW